MMKTYTLLIFLLFIVSLKSEDEIVEDEIVNQNQEGYVISLTDKTFEDFIREKTLTLAMFHAPWCSHCERLKPIYENVAKAVKTGEFKIESSIEFVRVDATKELELSKQYSITRFPTLIFFRNYYGQMFVHHFDGDLTDEKTILTYLKNEANSNWTPDIKKVPHLISSNFTRWVQNRQLSLINFHINNCEPCKKLEPEFEKAFKYLEKNEKPIYLAHVECDKEEELCEKYQIKGYPTMAIFREGRPFDYNGGRNASDIIEFMLKSQRPASIEVHSFATFKTYIKNPIDNYVIGIFNEKNHALFDSYMKFTSRYPEDLKMFHTFNYEDFLNHMNVNLTIPAIVAYFPDAILTKNEPNAKAFSKPDADADEIEQFVLKRGLPTISVVNHKSKRYIFSHKRPACFVFYDVDLSPELRAYTIYYRNKLEPVAQKYPEIAFALVDEHEHLDMMKDFGLYDREDDISLVCLNEKHNRFIFDGDFETSEIDKFVANFATNELKPKYRSEIEPKSESGNLIRTVVGSSFERLVRLERKDVFIYFYKSRDCINCTKLEKVFVGMAKKLEKNKNLVFAKIDTELNEHPDEFRYHSLPALFYYGSHNKQPVLMSNFNIETPLEELMKYVEVLLKNADEKKMEDVKVNNKNEL